MEEKIYKPIIGVDQPKITRVKVENLRLRCYIGFNNWEREKMQDLVISFSFKHNAARAVKTDDEAFTLNYKTITKSIIKLIEHQKFALIETVAEIIWEHIKQNPFVIDVNVRVEKPHALRFCDNVLVEIFDEDRWNEVIISLGSNISPQENVDKTLEALSHLGSITKKTDFIFTKPLKFTDQPDFLNGAVSLQTKLYYEALKKELKEIEQQLGRIRTNNKNAPRTIDLDIITFNSTIVDKELNDFDFLVRFVNELNPNILKTI